MALLTFTPASSGGGAISGTSGMWEVQADGDLSAVAGSGVVRATNVVTPGITAPSTTMEITSGSGALLALDSDANTITCEGDLLPSESFWAIGSAVAPWEQVTAAIIQTGTYTVATLPGAETAGQVVYVSDGAAGNPVLAFSNGTNWLRCDTLAAVSSS